VKILKDITYYKNGDNFYEKEYHYDKLKNIYFHSIGTIDIKLLTENEFNKGINNDYKFSHKIRVIDYYSKIYKRNFELDRDLKNWRNDGLWGGYNRLYKLNHDELEKEYQTLLRTSKLERILFV
jgi:hypothetical protein